MLALVSAKVSVTFMYSLFTQVAPEQSISWSGPHKGRPITKQWLSYWIVEPIALGYASQGLQVEKGLWAHSTHGLVASWAIRDVRGTELQATGWTSQSETSRSWYFEIWGYASTQLSFIMMNINSS